MYLIFVNTQNLFMLILETDLNEMKRRYGIKGKCSAQHRSDNPIRQKRAH